MKNENREKFSETDAGNNSALIVDGKSGGGKSDLPRALGSFPSTTAAGMRLRVGAPGKGRKSSLKREHESLAKAGKKIVG